MTPGDFDSPDDQRFLIDPYVNLAPDAAFRAAIFGGLPFTVALEFDLDASAIDERVQ